jgi:ectoine hydroxylase-related dioxygenase (phytanoyl-CoA dioxygenase family)
VTIDTAARTAFREDGVICLRDALGEQTLAMARTAYHWSLANPGPGASELPGGGAGGFYQDLANPAALEVYAPLVRDTEIGDLIAALWEGRDVWFMYEQVFSKTGAARRTPWHQDSPYLPVRGEDLAVMWISFAPVPGTQALEFVRGSQRGTLYDGSRFDPADDTAPLYGDGTYPRLPDIEADRARWPIVSWATEPGDVLVFHPALLHGGGATPAGGRRETLSLRFFGTDAVVARRPGMTPVERVPESVPDPTEHPLTRMRTLPDGSEFRDRAFPRVRP